MTLTVERMNKLMVAVTMGKPVKAKNKEEADFVESIQDDVDEALTNGTELRIPPE